MELKNRHTPVFQSLAIAIDLSYTRYNSQKTNLISKMINGYIYVSLSLPSRSIPENGDRGQGR